MKTLFEMISYLSITVPRFSPSQLQGLLLNAWPCTDANAPEGFKHHYKLPHSTDAASGLKGVVKRFYHDGKLLLLYSYRRS